MFKKKAKWQASEQTRWRYCQAGWCINVHAEDAHPEESEANAKSDPTPTICVLDVSHAVKSYSYNPKQSNVTSVPETV